MNETNIANDSNMAAIVVHIAWHFRTNKCATFSRTSAQKDKQFHSRCKLANPKLDTRISVLLLLLRHAQGTPPEI